jgi:hypothetical protein
MGAAVALAGATVVGAPGPPTAEAADPVQVSFKLEGCNRDPETTLPNSEGEFICPDSDYTTGNTGLNWAELDLQPFRLTTNVGQTQTYTIAVGGDAEDAGAPGYDAVTEPTLNQGLSDPTCTEPQSGPQQVKRPGIGGVDATIYRNITISATAGQHCVYDYAMRIALGASDFPGSSLSARLAFEDLNGSPGQQNVGTPVAGLNPQELDKEIRAARGDGYLWTVNKTTTGASPVDTCVDDPTASFTTTIHWDREPVTGEVTWVTTIFATNPSSRDLIIRVRDVVRADDVEVADVLSDRVRLPALSTRVPVFTHAGSAPAGTRTVSDTATGTYLDLVTLTPVGETTTATASTGVTVVSAGNDTAEITDVTTADGSPVTVDSITSGTVDPPLGVSTSGPITWESGVVSSSGEATITFTADLEQGFEGTVSVADTATLRHALGESTATGQTDVLANAADPTITFVKTVDVPPTEDATFFFEVWFAGDDPATDPSILAGPVTIPAGQTQSQSVTIDLPPSPVGNIYLEQPAEGYVGTSEGTIQPLAKCDHLDGEVSNERQMGSILVVKEVNGDQVGADATVTVEVDCDPGTAYDQTLTVPPGPPGVETDPIPSGTSCRMTEPSPPDHYELVSIVPTEVVVQVDESVSVTVTNERLSGSLTVTKVIEGTVGTATTTFPVAVDCTPGTAYDQTAEVTVTPPDTTASVTFDDIPSGLICTVTEASVPEGWALDSVTPDGGQVTIPDGGTAEVTFTNVRQTGSLVVVKQASGPVAGAPTEFSVAVDCDDGANQTLTLDVGTDGSASATIDGIPTGTICTVSEDVVPDGWTLDSIQPAQVTISADPDEPVTVTVTNSRETAAFDVVKQVDGALAPADSATFEVEADCPDPVGLTTLTLTVTEDDGTATGTVEGVPVGAECSVEETSVPEGWTLTSIDPNPVTVNAGDSDTVTVTNTRELGELRIVKRLDGPVAGADTDFTLDLDCDYDPADQQVQLTVSDGQSAGVTVSEIPTGTTCVLTESSVSDGWALESIEPSVVTVGTQPVELVVTNVRELGGLEIIKVLLGPVDGASTTFSAFLDCDYDPADQRVVIEVQNGVAKRTEVTGIPVGVTCTATEVRVPPKWSLGGVAGGNSVTITDTELMRVVVVNTRVTGDLDVIKMVRGGPADEAATFEVFLDCEDDEFDRVVPIDVAAGETSVREQFSGIPTGVTCSVSEESLPAGWRLVSIEPEQATVRPQEPREFTVVNMLVPDQPAPTPTPTPTPPGPTAVGPTDQPPSGGDLPGTGSPMPGWLIVLFLVVGLGLIVGGVRVIWHAR